MELGEKLLAKIRPVILCGGSGTRLWPVSREEYPKQFVPLFDGISLFAKTLNRVNDRTHYAPPLIISNIAHKFHITSILKTLGVTDAIILLEPYSRNTAAPAIIAALHEIDSEPGTLHLVMPSDHIIDDEIAFHDAITRACTLAAEDIVLFGIAPTHPATGYGYILADGNMKIAKFHEKPAVEQAQEFIEKGALWNSGIFLYAPSLLLKEAKLYDQVHLEKCKQALAEATRDPYNSHCLLLGGEAYAEMQSPAFDTLIMENTTHGAVVKCEMGWSDVGSWQAMYEVSGKDTAGNSTTDDAIIKDTTNCYIHSEGRKIAVLGMDNCMIIDTPDALLIAPLSRAEEVKTLVAAVKTKYEAVVREHHFHPRPWGTYEIVARGKNFLVKQIIVWPGRSLSEQKHTYRSEHWMIVEGTAQVMCDGKEEIISVNQPFFIPIGSRHRLRNPGKTDLRMIEIQSGDYIGEDDITRFEDMYGRV